MEPTAAPMQGAISIHWLDKALDGSHRDGKVRVRALLATITEGRTNVEFLVTFSTGVSALVDVGTVELDDHPS